jgi:hypothetical protein
MPTTFRKNFEKYHKHARRASVDSIHKPPLSSREIERKTSFRRRVRFRLKKLIYTSLLLSERLQRKVSSAKSVQKPIDFLKQRPKQSLAAFFVLLTIIGILVFSLSSLRAATYGWIQLDWSGGVDTSNFPNHIDNKTGWNKYFSKGSTINTTIAGEVTLSLLSATLHDTDDADFSTGSMHIVNVQGNSVFLLKAPGAACLDNSECNGNRCDGGFCRYPWLVGSIPAIEVYDIDISTTRQWKTSSTDCRGPHCELQFSVLDGSDRWTLVADNTIDFSEYPARNACKQIGGRLPTVDELRQIYEHQSDYGTFQTTSSYWSATEVSTSNARIVSFSDGGVFNGGKGTTHRVRCIRDTSS